MLVQWEDAWDGSIVSGPKTIEATQPYERQPMWHKKDGGLTVLTDSPGLRIEDGDWSTLTLEAYPAKTAKQTQRNVFSQDTHIRGEPTAHTEILMNTDGMGNAEFKISASSDGAERAWVVRLHLRPNQRVISATVDGQTLAADELVHLAPNTDLATHFPFGGAGSHPAKFAGPVAELRIQSGAHPRSLKAVISELASQ